MRLGLQLLMVCSMSACNAPPEAAPPAAPPVEQPAEVALTPQQLDERAARCGSKSRAEFRRALKEGEADFAFHYNAKLDTCFYLLTVNRPDKVRRTLIDIYENEIYGRFAESPAGKFPDDCEVVSIYCSSQREWEVLVSQFMEG